MYLYTNIFYVIIILRRAQRSCGQSSPGISFDWKIIPQKPHTFGKDVTFVCACIQDMAVTDEWVFVNRIFREMGCAQNDVLQKRKPGSSHTKHVKTGVKYDTVYENTPVDL